MLYFFLAVGKFEDEASSNFLYDVVFGVTDEVAAMLLDDDSLRKLLISFITLPTFSGLSSSIIGTESLSNSVAIDSNCCGNNLEIFKSIELGCSGGGPPPVPRHFL